MSFCVKCGAEGPLYDRVCASCFLKDKRFSKIADHVDLTRCGHCQEFGLGNKWVSFHNIEAAVREAAMDAVQVLKGTNVENMSASVLAADRNNYKVHLDLDLEVQGLAVQEELDTIVRLKNASCGRCSKIVGSYFEATLQIRSRDRKLEEKEIDQMLERVHKLVSEMSEENRDIFISKEDRNVGGSGGADVNLSSISAGKIICRELADQYGAEVKETAKLITQKEGREVYRVTFLVRLPAYRFGDVLTFRGKMYLVGPMRTTSAKLTDMRSGENVMFSHSDLTEAKVVKRKEEMLDAVLLTETVKEVQILHPVSLRPVELRKPPKYQTKGDMVKVFILDEELYLLPK